MFTAIMSAIDKTEMDLFNTSPVNEDAVMAADFANF